MFLTYRNRFIEAANDCEDALKIDSTLIKLHLRKASALLRMGHLSSCDEAYSRVLEYSLGDVTATDPLAGSKIFTFPFSLVKLCY